MSNLFEEFSENDPYFINLEGIETDEQRRLRECFELLAERNMLEIELFEPRTPESFAVIRCKTHEKEIEASEPQLAVLLRIRMLRSIQLETPHDDDCDLVRDYSNGKCVKIFTISRNDTLSIPVYTELNEQGVPESIILMSHAKLEETILHYRDLDEYRSRLVNKLGIGRKALRTFSVEELKDFDMAFNTIQAL